MSRVNPVWFNANWAKNALELYEGVSKHAAELNVGFGFFFGLTQKFSLDSVVIETCKLFDTSNERYEKNTVPALCDYLTTHLTNDYIPRLDVEKLTRLGIPNIEAERMLREISAEQDLENTKVDILSQVRNLMPTRSNNPHLEKLFLFRNKVTAHSERLNEVLTEELRNLPSIDEIEKIVKWANNFCQFAVCVMTPSTAYVNSSKSARMAALNVAKKVLDKNFDDPSKTVAENSAAQEVFYSRL